MWKVSLKTWQNLRPAINISQKRQNLFFTTKELNFAVSGVFLRDGGKPRETTTKAEMSLADQLQQPNNSFILLPPKHSIRIPLQGLLPNLLSSKLRFPPQLPQPLRLLQ